MTHRTLLFADLPIDAQAILSELLGPDQEGSDAWALSREVIQEGIAVCRPRYSFVRFDQFKLLSASSFQVEQVEFRAGKIITQALSQSEQIYLLVATAGEEFNAWIDRQSADIMRLFVADTMGSALAEATARVAEKEITSLEQRTTNPYSPGYCNWHVSEQQKFFSLLPAAPSGVTINESSLMNPIKSVSSMVGCGPQVVRQPYGCAICTLASCYKRSHNTPR